MKTETLGEEDVRLFKLAMSSFASGVIVVTVRTARDEPIGMTATTSSSVSLDPLLVLIGVNRTNRTYQYITEQNSFGVNILGARSRNISDFCAQPGVGKVILDRWLREDVDQNPALRLHTSAARWSRRSKPERTRFSSGGLVGS